MDVNKFYELRSNFILIGITGRMRGGANVFGELLCSEANPFIDENLTNEIDAIKTQNTNEGLKHEILKKFICYDNGSSKNWNKFELLEYKKVIFFHLLFDCYKENGDLNLNLIKKIIQLGKYRDFKFERFGNTEESEQFITNQLREFLNKEEIKNYLITFNFSCPTLEECLKSKNSYEIYNFFFDERFSKITNDFYSLLDSYSLILRQRLIQSLSLYYRLNGRIDIDEISEIDKRISEGNFEISLDNIYTIAKTINRLVKAFRDINQTCNIVIDSLKNSFEINYFKERYSAFYLVTVNKNEKSRIFDIKEKVKKLYENDFSKIEFEFAENKKFDDNEYKTNDFKNGLFCSPDIENCIQKSDYHIFINDFELDIDDGKELVLKDGSVNISYSEVKELVSKEVENNLNKKNNLKNSFVYKSLKLQILKLICLIKQPGIISPSSIERNMHIAFNAKLNSGCISRQVGAVITDQFFSVKSVGWNEVPEGQTPCSLRNIYDLKKGNNANTFTRFEKSDSIRNVYTNGKTFKENATDGLIEEAEISQKLQGRNCPFCFKEFHNSFEGEKNQVHTRSLHAEENAMMQIAKYGGQSIKGGNLFTTASPCELCSKKAYQLGIRNIFYIDPYPGISKTQILSGGNNPENNPNLFMFQGAIGRGYNKLYEPFMSIKDETKLRSNIKPKKMKPKLKDLEDIIAQFTPNEIIESIERVHKNPSVEVMDFSKINIDSKK